jgi:hypothetical protein
LMLQEQAFRNWLSLCFSESLVNPHTWHHSSSTMPAAPYPVQQLGPGPRT